jgi:hypothetical protein
MRRLPGPADCRLCERVQTLEALLVLFRDWQRTPTQSSVRTLRSLRLQMDVRFCQVQEPPAERHGCAMKDPDPNAMRALRSAPSGLVFFLLTLTYMEVGYTEGFADSPKFPDCRLTGPIASLQWHYGRSW